MQETSSALNKLRSHQSNAGIVITQFKLTLGSRSIFSERKSAQLAYTAVC